MNKTITWIIVLILVIVGFFILSKKSEPVAAGTIKIGVILPMTGEAGTYGQNAQKGVEIALEKVNKENINSKLEAIYEDSQMDPKKAVSAAQKLVDIDKVKYIVGFSSGEMLAICPITEANKVLFIGSGSSPEISKCGDYTFRDSISDIYQGKELARIISSKNYKKVAVLYINNDYGTGLKDEFVKNFSGTVVDVESYVPKQTDFRTVLTKIKSSEPEAIMVVSQLPESANLLKQKTELAMVQPIFGSETFKDDNLFQKVSSDAMKNVYTVFMTQYNGSEYTEYKDAYLQKYGQEFGTFSDVVHDSVLILADAIKRAEGTDVDSVKKAMYSTNMKGATGLIKFDQNGDVVDKNFSLYKATNGKFVLAE